MKWRQFFTPVQSLAADEARALIADHAPDAITILDVRQPGEYQGGHIPGAKLIPLPELGDRIQEIDPQKPTVVYCAVGGRSRIAAQMLNGKGFARIYNLSGGMKAWEGQSAIGSQDQGLSLFADRITARESLLVAYSMEQGLRDFYLTMMGDVQRGEVRALFRKLADIEINHQQRVFDEYRRNVDETISREAFEAELVPGITEGGLSTSEYLALYNPDINSSTDVIGMAMAIEAQALDLYQRAAETASDPKAGESLKAIASEERSHLNELGKLMDQVQK